MNATYSTPKRQIRNPEAWIGKRIPRTYSLSNLPIDMLECDCCGRWFHADDLHNILYPVSDFDWTLMAALHIEEAQGFCPDCLTKIERQAEAIDPDWYTKHLNGSDEQTDRKVEKPSARPDCWTVCATDYKGRAETSTTWLTSEDAAQREAENMRQLGWRKIEIVPPAQPKVRPSFTANFLLRRAADLEAQAADLYARAEVAARYGLCEHAVRLDCRAVEMEDYAEVLRLQAQRVADMETDAREMRAEGCTPAEIDRYIARTYGKAVKS